MTLVAVIAAGACGGDRGQPTDEAGAGPAEGAEPPAHPPRVVASIFPVADLARRVGGDAVRVDVLLPPRASPATFEATPEAVRTVAGARLHILVGGALDAWAASLVEGTSEAPLVVLTRDVELLGRGHEPGTGNPHVWLDPIRTRDHLLPPLVEALVRMAPGSEGSIRSRGRALADTLTALDREIDARLEAVRSRPFVTAHPAWAYYVDRYDLLEVGSIHGHPGQEPSARALAELIRTARKAGVRAVFSEPQMPAAAARALAEELGVSLLALDPLGGPGLEGRSSYPALLRFNTDRIVRGLGGGRG